MAVSPRIRKNFSQPSQHGIKKLRKQLHESYFPSWFSGVDMDAFLKSPEARAAFDNHLTDRLEMDRYSFIPWIESVASIKDSHILEIGCGTGSATVALAEQGGSVVGLDVHAEALAVAELRAEVHGIKNASFMQGNAENLQKLTQQQQFNLIIFFAVLEHMTYEERRSALKEAWNMLPDNGYLCIAETPNRLWFNDTHTSELPFYHWLPDELAFEYSKVSPRYPFNIRFDDLNKDSMITFLRDGRGFSFHEIDLALGDSCSYQVVSDLTTYLMQRNPAIALKRVAAGDGRREKLLNSYSPDRHRGFFREYINLIIKKRV